MPLQITSSAAGQRLCRNSGRSTTRPAAMRCPRRWWTPCWPRANGLRPMPTCVAWCCGVPVGTVRVAAWAVLPRPSASPWLRAYPTLGDAGTAALARCCRPCVRCRSGSSWLWRAPRWAAAWPGVLRRPCTGPRQCAIRHARGHAGHRACADRALCGAAPGLVGGAAVFADRRALGCHCCSTLGFGR